MQPYVLLGPAGVRPAGGADFNKDKHQLKEQTMYRYEEISKSYWSFNNSFKSYKGECEDFIRNFLLEFQSYLGKNDCIEIMHGDTPIELSDRKGIAESLFLEPKELDFIVTFRINHKSGEAYYKIGVKKLDDTFVVKFNPYHGTTIKLKTNELDTEIKKLCADVYARIIENNNNGFYALAKTNEGILDIGFLRKPV